MRKAFHKKREKPLRLIELIAIAIGGMIGGGIFSVLGVSVEKIGNATPIAIFLGGCLALLAAYSYVKLALYYLDEGATYSFYKRTFKKSHFSASSIGWYITFGYISTLALYAFTFSSYVVSLLPVTDVNLVRNLVAGGVLVFFTIINLVSVKGMGRVEDFIVYLKLLILVVIAVLLGLKGDYHQIFPVFNTHVGLLDILIISSITFVAYEGFQLVIHAVNEMEKPKRNIPRAIYSAIGIAVLVYVVLAFVALISIPKTQMMASHEYAFAAGAGQILGHFGLLAVIVGVILATSSAINGTIFGASRLMAVIAEDGYFPRFFSVRHQKHIPSHAILFIFVFSYLFIWIGGLETILEFGSITFLLVSFLMAYANFKIRHKTNSHIIPTLIAMAGLAVCTALILYYEYTVNNHQFFWILGVYAALTIASWLYSVIRARQSMWVRMMK